VKRQIPGLAEATRDSHLEVPDGIFLVRVEGAQFRWHAQKRLSNRTVCVTPQRCLLPDSVKGGKTVLPCKPKFRLRGKSFFPVRFVAGWIRGATWLHESRPLCPAPSPTGAEMKVASVAATPRSNANTNRDPGVFSRTNPRRRYGERQEAGLQQVQQCGLAAFGIIL